MKRCIVMTSLLLGCASAAFAGHGLINSFAGIEWLPDPSTTPSDFTWTFEQWRESRALAALEAPRPRLVMRLDLARERLAEAVAEVRQERPEDAQTALDAYALLIASAHEDLAAEEKLAAEDVRRYAEAMLEHRYILATEYFDLPRGTRQVLASGVTAAAAQYQRVRARFSRREQESLFFKEEEVRWAWEQAQAADAQGL